MKIFGLANKHCEKGGKKEKKKEKRKKKGCCQGVNLWSRTLARGERLMSFSNAPPAQAKREEMAEREDEAGTMAGMDIKRQAFQKRFPQPACQATKIHTSVIDLRPLNRISVSAWRRLDIRIRSCEMHPGSGLREHRCASVGWLASNGLAVLHAEEGAEDEARKSGEVGDRTPVLW